MTIAVGAPGIVVPPVEAVAYTAKRNEDKGYDSVWYPDHLMGWHPQSLWNPEHAPLSTVLPNVHAYYDPSVAITAAAVATERITLGSSVTEPVRNHPAQLARTWLSLDHISGGRAILGIGAGEGENITPYGLAFDKPATRLEDALRVVRLLWENDDPVDYDGPVYHLRDAVCGLAPLDKAPPIWVAAHGPRLCRVTGELADGWLPTTIDVDEYEQKWNIVRSAATKAGRDPDALTAGMWAYTVIAADHEESHRLLQHPMIKALTLALPDSFFQARGATHPLGEGTHGFLEYVPSRLTADEAMRAIDAIPDAVVHDAVLHGSPSDLAAKTARYAAVGLRHIVFWNMTFMAGPQLVGPSYRLLDEAREEIKRIDV
jgi:phthiodiolone/phenolphthiodiolone dimycocerosates ketoreductase